jgi:hypothetical protein
MRDVKNVKLYLSEATGQPHILKHTSGKIFNSFMVTQCKDINSTPPQYHTNKLQFNISFCWIWYSDWEITWTLALNWAGHGPPSIHLYPVVLYRRKWVSSKANSICIYWLWILSLAYLSTDLHLYFSLTLFSKLTVVARTVPCFQRHQFQ